MFERVQICIAWEKLRARVMRPCWSARVRLQIVHVDGASRLPVSSIKVAGVDVGIVGGG